MEKRNDFVNIDVAELLKENYTVKGKLELPFDVVEKMKNIERKGVSVNSLITQFLTAFDYDQLGDQIDEHKQRHRGQKTKQKSVPDAGADTSGSNV
ncbi:hypothetical protein ACXWTF_12585 [Thiomicrolovo sp. ZZH C-3]